MSAGNGLDFATKLWQLLKVPLVTCKPAIGKDEFHYPPGDRDGLTADDNQNQLSKFRPGWAVMARTGDPIAVVDVDPKNGGDVEKTRQLLEGLNVRIFAENATPGDGRHFYIAGHPDLPSCSNLNGWPGIDILSHGRLVFLPGTQRPKYNGRGYEVIFDNLETLNDGGDPDGAEAFLDWVTGLRGQSEQFETTSPWQGGEPDTRQSQYLTKMLTGIHRDLSGMVKNSGRNTAVYNKALKCGNYIAGAGLNETTATDLLLDASKTNGLVQEDGERSVTASIRSGIKNGKTRPRAVPEANGQQSTNGHTPPPPANERLKTLTDLIAQLQTWQDLPDPTHLIAALATAATRHEDGEPCWLLLVAPPSSGKTETVRGLDGIAAARLDDVTSAGLLSWSKSKPSRPVGILTQIGSRGLITFGDLSTLLASSDRGAKDHLFALLRRIYDGHASRDIAPPSRTGETPGSLEWTGRLTVIACVTGIIDRYSTHADQLGPRWIYCRIPERTTQAKRSAARLARRGKLTELRAEATKATTQLIAQLPAQLAPLPDPIADAVEDAALVTAWGRVAVPRSGYGRREIEDISVLEEPMRLVQQLGGIARGALALGLTEHDATVLARRVALDSMPAARHAVLKALSAVHHNGEALSTATIAKAADLHSQVARFALEDLATIGVVESDRHDDPDTEQPNRVPVHWMLNGDDGELIAEVFAARYTEALEVTRKVVFTHTSPPNKGGENGHD